MTSVAFVSIHGDPLASLGGSHHGGQNVYVKAMSSHLGKLGLRVDVFSRWESPDQPAVEAIGPGARVIRVQVGPPEHLPKERTILFLEDLADWIHAFKHETAADYQLMHGHYYFSGGVGLSLQERWQVPFVETFHSLGLVKRQALGSSDPSPTSRLEIERRVAQTADLIIATAPQEKVDLTTEYGADPSRIRVIPCGVDLELFKPIPRGEARDDIGVPDDWFLLTFVGRLERRKGVDTILEAMGLLMKERPALPLHAVIVGGHAKDQDPADMPEPEQREHRRFREIMARYEIEDRVSFTGGLPQRLLYRFYAAADVTIIPSYYEPFGMTALEALGCGSSVIASRVGGLKTTVEEGQVGLQFEAQDARDLADKIGYLVESPKENERLRSNARPYVERNYSWNAVSQQVATAYQELLEEQPKERQPR
ncbi:MAG: glycosyltransferase [Anaerolineae bacterium]|jgi:glycosyltransferase involved in cell wall biosynthesis